MSSAAHKLAIVHGNVNRPPVRFLFVGSTTAAYFFGRHRNRLGNDTHIATSLSFFLHFLLVFCCCLFVDGDWREGEGYGGGSPRHTFPYYNPEIKKHRQQRTEKEGCA